MTCAECGMPINAQKERVTSEFGPVHPECYALMPKTLNDWKKYSW